MRKRLMLLPLLGLCGIVMAAVSMNPQSTFGDGKGIAIVPGQSGSPSLSPAAWDGPAAGPMLAAFNRSALYPTDWLPIDAGGSANANGQFLHDFSYAGYRGVEIDPALRAIPATLGTQQVTADAPSGGDDTAYLQGRIDFICANGGGVLTLQAGTYRVAATTPAYAAPQQGGSAALYLSCSSLIVRGQVDAAGAPTTRILNTRREMRFLNVIRVGPRPGQRIGWFTAAAETAAGANRTDLVVAAERPTRVLRVADAAGYNVGDWIMVRADRTDDFIAQHGMRANENTCVAACWQNHIGLGYYRRVMAIDTQSDTLTVDIPTRYYLRPGADGNLPRVYRLDVAGAANSISNVGLENVTIGMLRANGTTLGDNDYNTAGTTAYDVNQAYAVRYFQVRNGWARNVRSFEPDGNGGVHLLSGGLIFSSSRGLTIDNCHFGYPQYRGAGGNGYMFTIVAQDSVLRNSVGTRGRHNFLFQGSMTSGNVLINNISIEGRLDDDYHGELSHANLVEQHTLRSTRFFTANRGNASNGGGHTGTQNVFWNIIGQKTAATIDPLVTSAQFGWGYVIGTRAVGTGAFATVSNPTSGTATGNPSFSAQGTGVGSLGDYVEGVGEGAALVPQSLFQDQFRERFDGRPSNR